MVGDRKTISHIEVLVKSLDYFVRFVDLVASADVATVLFLSSEFLARPQLPIAR